MTARPLSPAEAAIVARFDAAEPAPESWRGDDGLRADWDGPLRTALVQAVEEHADMWGADTTPQGYADAILALPEVAALRAKAAKWDEAEAVRDAFEPTIPVPVEVMTELRAKAAAADRVRELHHRVTHDGPDYCDACALLWPCITRRALDGPSPC